jgi:hypothetical protein
MSGQNDPALLGLPQYGVTLSGSPKNPVVENHSGKTVIGYVVKTADQNGQGTVNQQLLTLSVQPQGTPDGGAVYVNGAVPVNSPGPMASAAQLRVGGRGPVVRATLQSVVFSDGQFVGLDDHGTFDQFGKRIKAITEVGILAKTQAWNQVEALAPRGLLKEALNGEDQIVYLFRQLAASRLVETRRLKGDAAAGQMAEIYSSLPTLWK